MNERDDHTVAGFRKHYGPWGLVAGAGQGLGAAWASALARRGLNLVLVDMSTELVTSVAADLERRYGATVEPLVLDLGDEAMLERVARATEDREVGLLVYNAAVSTVGHYLDEDLSIHERLVAVNCNGPARLTHHFGRRMRTRGRGGIVLMSSMSAFQGNPMLAHYAASKAYNLVLAEGLWDECRGDGVDVLACCPGATLTPGYLLTRPARGRLTFPTEMEPDDVVEAALVELGRRPHVVPGWGNRVAAMVIQRLLPRRRAIALMGRIGRTLEPKTRL